MKVFELIELLEKCNQEAIVIMAGDEEGNYYNDVSGIDEPLYMDGDGNIGFNSITPELREQGYGDDDLVVGEECVVLFP